MKINFFERPASVVLRVTAFVGLTIILSLFCLTWVLQKSISHHFAEMDAEELDVVAHSIQQSLEKSVDDEVIKANIHTAVAGHHGIYFLVVDDSQHLLYATPGPDLLPFIKTYQAVNRVRASTLNEWTAGETRIRGAALSMKVGEQAKARSYTVVVATEMDSHLHFTRAFNQTLWLIMIGIGIMTVIAAWFAIRQGHAPLRRVSDAIRSITSDRLDSRLPVENVPEELVDLTLAFNEMIDRIETMVQKLAAFSSDIAHELRTPLTTMITQSQVALGNPRSLQEYQEILYSLLEEQESLAKLVNDMLWLAQTDNQQIHPKNSQIDVRQVMERMFEYFEAWSEDRQITFNLEGDHSVIEGDLPMLKRVFNNLLSNAIRYSAAGHVVNVRLNDDCNNVRIAIESYGETIPAVHIPKLFERFYRIDSSRKRDSEEGVGLGLAIVKSIIDIHHGSITVTSNDRVTVFEISLPKEPLTWTPPVCQA